MTCVHIAVTGGQCYIQCDGQEQIRILARWNTNRDTPATATVADKKEQEEDTEKKPDAKKARKVTADKEGEKKTTDEVSEENKSEEAPEVAVPEPEVSSSTR